MTWFKVDDSFHSHPKVLATDPAALGLWVLAGSWSSAHLTEGVVQDDVLPRLLPDAATLARKLVTAGLWKRVRGGYQFHDWLDRNPTREAVAAERKANAERQRRFRDRQATLPTSVRDQGTQDQTQSTQAVDNSPGFDDIRGTAGQAGRRNAVTNGPSNAVTNSAPTRPDPTLIGGNSLTVGNGHARASPAEPPRNCPEHLDNPDPPPCGRCADARRAHDRWEAQRAARIAAAPKCRRHRGEPAANCGRCRSEALAPEDS